jgi:hypothetical protein
MFPLAWCTLELSRARESKERERLESSPAADSMLTLNASRLPMQNGTASITGCGAFCCANRDGRI